MSKTFHAWISRRDFAVLPLLAISHPTVRFIMIRAGWFCFCSALELQWTLAWADEARQWIGEAFCITICAIVVIAALILL